MRSLIDTNKLGLLKARLEPRLRWFLILAAFLICSLGLNLLLSRRVANLRALVYTLRSETQLSKGDKVPDIRARDPQGQPAVLEYAGTDLPTVVFIITPKCGWCTKNIMNMRTLVEKASDRYRFVALSIESDGLLNYVTENKLNFPIYTDLPLVPMKQYKLGGTPQTIIVSPKGEVLKVWSGAFEFELETEIEAYFGVPLPGVMDPEKAAS